MLKVMHRYINIRNHLKNTLSSQYEKTSRGELKHSPRLSRIGLLISPGSLYVALFRSGFLPGACTLPYSSSNAPVYS